MRAGVGNSSCKPLLEQPRHLSAPILHQHHQRLRIGLQHARQQRIEVRVQFQRVLEADVQMPALGQAEVGGRGGRGHGQAVLIAKKRPRLPQAVRYTAIRTRAIRPVRWKGSNRPRGTPQVIVEPQPVHCTGTSRAKGRK